MERLLVLVVRFRTFQAALNSILVQAFNQVTELPSDQTPLELEAEMAMAGQRGGARRRATLQA